MRNFFLLNYTENLIELIQLICKLSYSIQCSEMFTYVYLSNTNK